MNLDRALAFSRYAERTLLAYPALRDELVATLDAPFDWGAADRSLDEALAGGDCAMLEARLRWLRRRVFLHTLARDLTARATFAEVVQTMTALAERALRDATELHAQTLQETYGTPLGGSSGAPQRLIVVAMGKLGGGELNVSSDVDLVFVYPEEGETRGLEPISNREFFDRLGQRIVAALGRVDADGYVFRVDTRLRPYGESGSLTVSFAALERYLVTQGRSWERYAWLKARPLTGERHAELTELVAPFVYRKYLDYDAYEGLRDIHRQIREQEKRRDYADDIKARRRGNSRDRVHRAGAADRPRRPRSGPAAARNLARAPRARSAARGCDARGTRAARRLPVPARARASSAVSRRPPDATPPTDSAERAWLGESLGFASTLAFDAALASHRDQVARQFNAVFDAPDERKAAGEPPNRYVGLWDEPHATPETLLGARGCRV
jgi:Glutamine synthetase adenylyltransferase